MFCWVFFIGDTCTVQGCPGVGSSCSGNGLCTPGTQVCTCDSNWQGEGCDQPKCDGDPYQCNDKGNYSETPFTSCIISVLTKLKKKSCIK